MHKTNRVHVRPVHHVAVGEGAVERARAELHHLLVRAYIRGWAMFTDLHATYARKSQWILVAWGTRAIGAGCAGSRARSVWASMCARSALVSAVADGVHVDIHGQQTLAAVALDGDASECGGVQHGGVRAGQRVARCPADPVLRRTVSMMRVGLCQV